MHGRQMSSSAQIISPFFSPFSRMPSFQNPLSLYPSACGSHKPLFSEHRQLWKEDIFYPKSLASLHTLLSICYMVIWCRDVLFKFISLRSFLCALAVLGTGHSAPMHRGGMRSLWRALKKQAWNHVQLEGGIDTGVGTIGTRGCTNKVRRSCTFT